MANSSSERKTKKDKTLWYHGSYIHLETKCSATATVMYAVCYVQ